VDSSDLQCIRRGQVGKEARESAGKHRLASAGGPDEQQMMTSCCRVLKGDPCGGLPAHVSQIRRRRRVTGRARWFAIGPRQAVDQRSCDVGQRANRPHPIPRDQCCDRSVASGHQDPTTGGGIRQRDSAGDRANRAIEPKLAERADAVIERRKLARCGEDAERDGEIKACADLWDPTRSKVDRDAFQRPDRPRRHDGRPDPIAGFAARRIRQPDDAETGQTVSHVDFDRNRVDDEMVASMETSTGDVWMSPYAGGRAVPTTLGQGCDNTSRV